MSLMTPMQNCSYCKSQLRVDDGDLVCVGCGVIYEQKIPDASYDYDIGKNGAGGRTGPAHNPKLGLPQTFIGEPSATDKLNLGQKGTAKKLSDLDKRIKTDRVEIGAFMDIQKLTLQLGLNDQIAEFSKHIFNQCRKKKLLRGRKASVFAIGCIYTVCKIQNVARSLNEFCRIDNITRSEIIGIHHVISENINFEQNFNGPIRYLSKIKNQLNMSFKTETIVKKILKEYPKSEGKNPRILLAAAIYLASMKTQPITQRKIAIVMDCSEVAIRNRVQDMKKFIH